MCTRRDIDDILRQLENIQDPEHMRRLLEEADLCKKCPENLHGCGDQEPGCLCCQSFRTELQNYYYWITHQKK